ncbi:unnamed protein product [Allacma fusca]|uniref:Gustatory receptor n=1 Tax=Allacma fusca TaxID=39272 RepID=A0A8J2L6J2_9HEXA|nr:unnamed protein product [Allacma fusca]
MGMCFWTFGSSPDARLHSLGGFIFMSTFWNCSSFLHSAISLWIGSFMKITAGFLRIIAEELKEINHLRPWDKLNVEFLLRRPMYDRALNQCLNTVNCVGEIVEGLNSYLGVYLIADLVLCVLCIVTSAIFFVSWLGISRWDMIFSCCFMIFGFSIRVYFFGWGASKFDLVVGDVLEELTLICEGAEYYDEDTIFKVELMMNKLSASPLGVHPGHYFKLNKRFLVSVAATTLTYLIIMLQFRQAERNKQ